MASARNRTQSRIERIDAVQLIERTADRLTDEVAAITSPDSLVQFPNERIVKAYVQSHARTIAHLVAGPRDGERLAETARRRRPRRLVRNACCRLMTPD